MVHVSKATLSCCQNWEGVPGLRASPDQACFYHAILVIGIGRVGAWTLGAPTSC